MSTKTPNAPPESIFTIDLNPCKSFLVDLPAGARRGMRTEQDGWDAARSEILTKQATFGERAGITATDYNRFVTLDEQIAQIKARLPVVKKAVEVLKESLSHIDDQRHKLATLFARSAESHAAAEGGDPTLLTAYQKTIAYRSVVADKGVKTRQKNLEAAGTGGGAPAPVPAPEGNAIPKGGKGGAAVSRIPNPPPDNIFSMDLTPLKPFLVDLPEGARKGMRTEQAGWQDVVEEILGNQATYGDRAGITALDHARFAALNKQYALVLEHLPAMEKAEEVLVESLSHIDHQRHKLAAQFAHAAEAHAAVEGGDPTLLTAYEKTIAYRSVIADRALKTRKKNEEARRAAAVSRSRLAAEPPIA